MTVEEAEMLITSTRSARELFGADEDKAKLLRKKLLHALHPDRNPGDIKADSLYREVGRLWDLWKEPLSPPIVSPYQRYQTHSIIGVGDISDIHLATNITQHDQINEYALKISRVQNGEVLLKNEAAKLTRILKQATVDRKKTSYAYYFPQLIEDFPVKDKFQKHINVFTHENGFFDLEKVHEKHPVLDGRHIAWIFKRLLTAIGFAHQAGIVHAAVLPSHVRICPGKAEHKDSKAHALMLVGWGHSINDGEVAKTISAKYRGWYPLEILGKKAASFETDIYLAAKCMVYLSGGDLSTGVCPGLPKPMGLFIKSLLAEGQQMRPSSAWDLLEDFSDLVERLYGSPKFHHLIMA